MVTLVTCPGLCRGCTRLDVRLLVVLSPMGGVCKPKEVGFPLWLPHGLARVPSLVCDIGGPSATSQTPFITSPSPVLAGFVRLSLFIKDQSSTQLGCSSHLTGTRDLLVEYFGGATSRNLPWRQVRLLQTFVFFTQPLVHERQYFVFLSHPRTLTLC